MAKAGITIAISGTYNGRAMEKARRDLEKMHISSVKELGGAGSSLVEFGGKMAEVGGKIHNVGYRMEQVGEKATKGITVPMGLAAAACGSAAIDMDTALTGVRKTVDGTEAQYQELKDAAIEFSKTNAVSASQILDIQALGAQLGFAREELAQFGEVASGLDIATNMDAEQAGTELAQFANITKMAHSDIERYASAIVGLGNTSATTEADISSMAMRIAASGTQVGMSQADILGLAAALSSMGIDAEAGGTAISTIMAQIDKDIAKNSDDVQTWADAAKMSAEEFSEAWKTDPVEALSALFSGMEQATEEGGNMSLMLEDLGIDSVRQTDIMKRLAGNSELVGKSVATANEEWEKNTALQNEVDNRNQSLAARLQILQNKVTSVAEEVGGPMVDAALDCLEAADPLIEGAADMAKAFHDMDKEDQRMVLGLAAAAAAFGPAAMGTGKLLQGVGNLAVGMGKGMQKLGVFVHGLSDASKACGGVRPMLSQVAAGTLDLGDKARDASGKLTMASTATKALGSAMKATAIGLGAMAAAMIVEDLVNYAAHEKLVADATKGLDDATARASESFDGMAPSIETASSALDEIHASSQECLQSASELASKMRETWDGVESDAALVDSYAATIEELGNKGSLTASEQERLKVAVEGFNEQTGSSVGIINATTGELNTQKDAICEVTEAYKEQARQQAALELYKETQKELVSNEISLKQAQEALNEASEGFGIWLGDFPIYADEASVKYHEMQGDVEDLEASHDALTRALEEYGSIMTETAPTFDTFDAALEECGVSMSDFGDVSDEAVAKLRDNFDGSLNSIAAECVENGIKIPQGVADGIMSASGLPSEQAQVMLDAVVLEMTGGDVEKAAEILGHDIDQGLVDGIEGDSDLPAEAAHIMSDDTIAKAKDAFESHSPSQVMYRLGSDVDQGLANGISENSSAPQGAMSSLGSLLIGAISGLPGVSLLTGSSAGANLASGIGGNAGGVQAAGASLFASGVLGANPVISALGGIGFSAGSSLASNVLSNAGASRSAGYSIGSSAQGGASSGASGMGGVGYKAASTFSGAIGSSSAYSEGSGLAYTARSGMESVSAYSAGTNFVAGFRSGMYGISLYSVAYSVGLSALSGIKAALGIHSPSKEAQIVGEYFGEGAILGMRSKEGGIKEEAVRMADAMELEPNPATFETRFSRGEGGRYQPQRSVVWNVTINLNGQPYDAGRRIADELYLEMARRERA